MIWIDKPRVDVIYRFYTELPGLFGFPQNGRP